MQTIQEVSPTSTEARTGELIRVKPGKEPWLERGMSDEARKAFFQA